MANFSAMIRLSVNVFEAQNAGEAHDKVDAYISHLAQLLEADSGELIWPVVDWVVTEED